MTLREHISGATDFLAFTATALERLRTKIAEAVFAIGGYVLFVRYRHNGREMLLVAKLSQEEGAIFSSELNEVVQAVYLDLHRLQVAARIDLDAWRGEETRYLTFVMKKEDGHPSTFFRDFVGCRVEQDSKTESLKLVKVIRDFAQQMVGGKETLQDQYVEIQRRAFAYSEELRKQPEPGVLEFEPLANAVWPEAPDRFLEFVNTHADPPSSGFHPDRTTFRRLSAYNYRSDSLSLRMTHEFKQQHVTTEGNTVTIHDAPERLIAELSEN